MPAIFRSDSPRSSRRCWWFAASGGLGLSARALRSLQLCLLLFAVTAAPALIPLANSSARSTGAAVVLISACGTSTGRQYDGILAMTEPSVRDALDDFRPGLSFSKTSRA